MNYKIIKIHIISVAVLFCIHFNLHAQTPHIYSSSDSSCFVPPLVERDISSINDGGFYLGKGLGITFSTFNGNVTICGIGCVVPRYNGINSGYYAGLLRYRNNSFQQIDSVCIDNVTPTAFLNIPVCYERNYTDFGCTLSGDTLLPVLELFFDSCHIMNDDTVGIVIYNRNINIYNYRYSIILPQTVTNNSNFFYAGLVTFEERLEWVIANGKWFYGFFPILDSTLRQPRPCSDVYGLRGEYTALRQHTLSWSATTPHSLYQVAYGPTDADTDDYSVIETTDTFCTVTSPGLCERYAFRVRARCCNYAYDTNESWRPWSDTVHFFRPCNTVTLFSNDSSWGSVFGSGRYECDSTADIEARPEQGFLFSVWSDGDSNSMRTLTLSGDTTLTAFFAAPAGIDETANTAGITLSPNPASGSVQILTAAPILGADLLSLDGRQILHNSASNATGSHSLSLQLDSIPAGVYIVSVLTTLGHTHLKLVVR